MKNAFTILVIVIFFAISMQVNAQKNETGENYKLTTGVRVNPL